MNAVDLAEATFPRRLRDLHDRLREAAKSPLPDAPAPGSRPRSDDVPEPLEAQRRELEHLRLELARARGHIDALRAELEVRSLEPADLRDVVLGLEQQLVERDEELESFRQAVREGDAWRREMEDAERRTEGARRKAEEWVDALREELEQIKSTRLWSVGHRYWTLKERLRQKLGRGSS
jgi:chromosome segregation ATPase